MPQRKSFDYFPHHYNRGEIRFANLALISGRQMHMHQCVHFPRRHNKKQIQEMSFLNLLNSHP